MAFGVTNHYDGTPTPGVLTALAENVVFVDPNDEAGLAALLEEQGADIAAAILEPTGSSYGQVPLRPDFVRRLREETARRGIVLVFDEVVTGFRVARGGAQEALGIRPDLTTLAKILAGGCRAAQLSGGATSSNSSTPNEQPRAASRRSRIRAPTTPIRSRRQPGSRRWRSSVTRMRSRAPTPMPHGCAPR